LLCSFFIDNTFHVVSLRSGSRARQFEQTSSRPRQSQSIRITSAGARPKNPQHTICRTDFGHSDRGHAYLIRVALLRRNPLLNCTSLVSSCLLRGSESGTSTVSPLTPRFSGVVRGDSAPLRRFAPTLRSVSPHDARIPLRFAPTPFRPAALRSSAVQLDTRALQFSRGHRLRAHRD
jgi:hypothetical protein